MISPGAYPYYAAGQAGESIRLMLERIMDTYTQDAADHYVRRTMAADPDKPFGQRHCCCRL